VKSERANGTDKFEEFTGIYHEEAELFEQMLNRELPENLSEYTAGI
jgi:hypothetical protein